MSTDTTGSTGSTGSAMDAEFDTMASWVADAVAELGPEHALPAACRGSGSPEGLLWLADAMGVRRDATLLDVGAGSGGPAALLTSLRGAVTVLAEPMPDACRAARRLFGAAVLVAGGEALPVGDARVDHAWSVGVLDTVEDKAAHAAELARVVPGGATVGVLVYAAESLPADEQPEGNHLVPLAEVERVLGAAGLVVERRALVDDFETPEEWRARAARVEEVVERDHGDEEAWQVADRQHRAMAGLLADGAVVGHLLACRRAATG